MPRRNGRAKEPLDLTPLSLAARSTLRVPPDPKTREQLRREADERVRRQRTARINGGIDWSVCLVPNCDRSLQVPPVRDHEQSLPLCHEHVLAAYSNSRSFTDDPLMRDAADRYLAHRRASADAEKAAHLARTDGHIYYIQLGDLIKVGWTRTLFQRVKSYGASATLLACYKATRGDETNLHRQLTPVRAKGREWYEDGPLIRSFITKALKEHGEPPEMPTMWTQPKRVVAGKRHRS